MVQQSQKSRARVCDLRNGGLAAKRRTPARGLYVVEGRNRSPTASTFTTFLPSARYNILCMNRLKMIRRAPRNFKVTFSLRSKLNLHIGRENKSELVEAVTRRRRRPGGAVLRSVFTRRVLRSVLREQCEKE